MVTMVVLIMTHQQRCVIQAKLSQLSEELLRDINKETVSFIPNYDDTTLEPMVLPARFLIY